MWVVDVGGIKKSNTGNHVVTELFFILTVVTDTWNYM